MKGATLVLFFSVFSLPLLVFASTECSSTGHTIVFVNGVLNSEDKAKQSKKSLREKYEERTGDDSVVFLSGYNPSHLAGGADLIHSVLQAFGRPISTFDLDTVLMELHPQITTRKILLVGHSQGTFYTNEMYAYLINHGVPKESIAVYNIATPASFVAGGGQYITSSNDKIINAVRDNEVNGNVSINANSYYVLGGVVASALRANVTIPKESGYDTNKWGGHGFDVYLNAEASRIIREMNFELDSLKAGDVDASIDGCFVPPENNVAHKMQAAALSALDPLANVVASMNSKLLHGISDTFSTVAEAVKNSRGALVFSGDTALAQIAAVSAAVPQQTSQQKTQVVGTDSTSNKALIPAPTAAQLPPPEPTPVTDVPSKNDQPLAPTIPEPTTVQEIHQSQPDFGGGAIAAQPSASVSIVVSTPIDNAYVATTSVSFVGTATPSSAVSATDGISTSTTTVDGAGNWAISLLISEGAATVNFEATHAGLSATASRSIIVDVTAPAAPSVSIPACSVSLSLSFCLVPVTSIAASWNDSEGVSSYAVVRNGVAGAASAATSSSILLDSGATTTVAIVAYDAAGNAATTTPQAIYSAAHTLIINEIGWAGDDGDPSHQFIELKNASPFMLDPSRITLAHSAGTSVSLSSASPLSAGNFLVVEPVNVPFTGLNKIIATSSVLSTSGEQVSILWDGTIIDMTPAVATCGGWCAGARTASIGRNESGAAGLSSPLSMERVSDSSDGTLAASWHNTDSYGPWLGNAGAGVWGTPGVANSAGLPEAGVYCGSSSNIITMSGSFNPGSGDCVYLSRFISGSTFGVGRFNALYRGDVATSTGVGGNFGGKALAKSAGATITSPQPGEHFFFAMWEQRSGDAFSADSTIFQFYFTQGASSTQGITGPPHGNYVTIPFTYAP